MIPDKTLQRLSSGLLEYQDPHPRPFIRARATPSDVQLPEVSPYARILGRQASPTSKSHVLRFDDPICREEPLTGGKGSSLAVLTDISSKDKSVSVPQSEMTPGIESN